MIGAGIVASAGYAGVVLLLKIGTAGTVGIVRGHASVEVYRVLQTIVRIHRLTGHTGHYQRPCVVVAMQNVNDKSKIMISILMRCSSIWKIT